MKLPVLRVSTSTGMYLRRRLAKLCNELAKRPGAFGSAYNIIKGYLLRATKYNGTVTGWLTDLPAFVWLPGAYLDEQDAVFISGLLATLATGRDAVSPGAMAHPSPDTVTVIATPVVHTIISAPSGADGSFAVPIHYRVFNQHYSLTGHVIH